MVTFAAYNCIYRIKASLNNTLSRQFTMRKINLLSICLLFLGLSLSYGQLLRTATSSNTLQNNNDLKLKPYNQEALRRTGVVRCYTEEYNEELRRKYPEMGSMEDFERKIQAIVAKKKQDMANGRTLGGVYYLPVVVHVIHNGETVGTGSNISDAQVQDQITVLNEDFRKIVGTNGYNANAVGADSGIEFVLAKRTPAGAASNGINRVNRNTQGWSAPAYTTTYIDATIKPATYWDPEEYLNMWTIDISGGILGYAQFPSESGLTGAGCNGGGASTDGLVMGYQYFGRNLGGAYGDGRTATHEIGHGLGLRHIWGDANCGDDFCNDTPTHETSNFGCFTHPKSNTCGTTDEMFENYMDYTDDLCMNIFTQDQAVRMRAVMENSSRRKNLSFSPALLDPVTNYGGIINITAPSGQVCGSFTPSVTIKNLGSNNLTTAVVSYQIDGGAVQTTNWAGTLAYKATASFNLPVQSLAVGNHTIRAFVSTSNGAANATNTYVNEITVSFSVGTGTAIPYIENFESNIFPPVNWTATSVSGTCEKWVEQTNAGGTNGTTVALLYLSNTSGYVDELYTGLIDLTSASGTVNLTFDVWKNTGVSTASLKVDIEQGCNGTWTNLLNQNGATLSNNAWSSKTINVSAYVGQTIRLRFVGTSSTTSGYLLLDNIRVQDATPRVSFVSTTSTAAESPTTATGVGDCRPYTDVNIPLQINIAPTGNVVAGISITGGTAVNTADYQLLNNSVTFTSGSTANQNVVLRVFDDSALESLENLTLSVSITSGTALIAPTNTTHTASITDNDTAPLSFVSLLNENFESTAGNLPTGWITGSFIASAGVNVWRVGANGGMTGTYSAYITNNTTTKPLTYTTNGAGSTSDAGLITTNINTTGLTNITLTFDYKCNGEAGPDDYGTLFYSTTAQTSGFVQFGTTLIGQATSTSYTVTLPTACENQANVWICFRWINDNNNGSNPPFTIDNVSITSGTPIQTATFTGPTTAQQVYLGPNSTVYAYNPANGNLIARIENTSSHDYGCTQIYVDRAGTTASQFVTTDISEYLASKTIRVIPTNNNAAGSYNIRMYYTNTELTGWETTTSEARTSAVINKVSGAISAATAITPYTIGATTTQGVYGTDFWVESNFTNGFSGMGMGLPPGALPVKLISLQAFTEHNRIRVSWNTASEINITNFVVEKSFDGKEFFAIGNLEATNQGSYSIYDNEPKIGNNYYRLRIEENNNSSKKIYYSNIVSAIWGVGTAINAYPNPVSDKLQLAITSFEATQVQYKLFSPLGLVVMQGSETLAAQESKIQELNVKHLPKGVYILDVNSGNTSQQIKIVVR